MGAFKMTGDPGQHQWRGYQRLVAAVCTIVCSGSRWLIASDTVTLTIDADFRVKYVANARANMAAHAPIHAACSAVRKGSVGSVRASERWRRWLVWHEEAGALLAHCFIYRYRYQNIITTT